MVDFNVTGFDYKDPSEMTQCVDLQYIHETYDLGTIFNNIAFQKAVMNLYPFILVTSLAFVWFLFLLPKTLPIKRMPVKLKVSILLCLQFLMAVNAMSSILRGLLITSGLGIAVIVGIYFVVFMLIFWQYLKYLIDVLTPVLTKMINKIKKGDIIG